MWFPWVIGTVLKYRRKLKADGVNLRGQTQASVTWGTGGKLQSGAPAERRSQRRESRLVVRKTLAFVFTCVRGELLRSWEKRQWGHQCSAPTNSAKCSLYIHHYPMQIRHRPRKQSWSLCRQASHRFHADRSLPGHTSVLCWLHRAAVHLIKTKTSPP